MSPDNMCVGRISRGEYAGGSLVCEIVLCGEIITVFTAKCISQCFVAMHRNQFLNVF